MLVECGYKDEVKYWDNTNMLVANLFASYATLMKLKKAETAVHSC